MHAGHIIFLWPVGQYACTQRYLTVHTVMYKCNLQSDLRGQPGIPNSMPLRALADPYAMLCAAAAQIP